MIKKVLLFVLHAILLASANTVFAYDFSAVAPRGHILYYERYAEDTTEVVVVGYDGTQYNDPCLIIPSIVLHNGNTYTVVGIDTGAFYCNDWLHTLILTDSIRFTNLESFGYCSDLKTIVFGKSYSGGINGFQNASYHYYPSDRKSFFLVDYEYTPWGGTMTPQVYGLGTVNVHCNVICPSAYYGNNSNWLNAAIIPVSDDENMGTVELVSQAYCDENPYTGHTPDSIAIIAAYPNYGYHFSHWSDGDTTNPRSVYATQDSILFAYFEPNDYTITVQNEHIDWGSVVGNTVYQYLDTVVIEAVPTEHYHFLHWSQEHGYYEDYFYYNPLSFVITQDTIFQANFVPDTHHVEVTPNNIAFGHVYGSNDYAYGSGASVSAYPYSGYIFLKWSNGVTYNPYQFAVLSDTSFMAIFVEEGTTFNITVESADTTMGTVTGGGIYPALEQVILTANPKDGYQFDHWQDRNNENPRTITATSDSTFTAYFVSSQGIGDIAKDELNIYSRNGHIVVEGTTDEVRVFDMTGRNVRNEALSAGVYMVKVGERPARKVVVMK